MSITKWCRSTLRKYRFWKVCVVQYCRYGRNGENCAWGVSVSNFIVTFKDLGRAQNGKRKGPAIENLQKANADIEGSLTRSYQQASAWIALRMCLRLSQSVFTRSQSYVCLACRSRSASSGTRKYVRYQHAAAPPFGHSSLETSIASPNSSTPISATTSATLSHSSSGESVEHDEISEASIPKDHNQVGLFSLKALQASPYRTTYWKFEGI